MIVGVVAGVVAVLTAVTALGGAGVEAGALPAAKASSCSMLRSAEIQRALGQPVGAAKKSTAPGVCDWAVEATATRPAGSVHALVERGSRAQADYTLATKFSVEDALPVSGLGRKAFYTPALGTLWVLKDAKTLFYVQGLYPPGTDLGALHVQDALVKLAGKAAGRV
jgi:hypothetical protein